MVEAAVLLQELALLVVGLLASRLLTVIVLLVVSHRRSPFDLGRLRRAAEALRMVMPAGGSCRDRSRP